MAEKLNGGPRGPENLYALLEVDVTYEGWEDETGAQKAFYVRGFTWFRDQVINGRTVVTDCKRHIPRMKELIQSRPNWTKHRFNWAEPFGDRQFIDAASPSKKLTPKFHKAVEVLVLCEAMAEAMHDEDPSRPEPAAVYRHMRIEPAVSFIHGFDRALLENLGRDDDFMPDLRRRTGQKSNAVFFDMADGKTVTHKLAVRTHQILNARSPRVQIGDVDFRYKPKRIYKPSENEEWDAKVGLASGAAARPEAARTDA
jgi:hypothetical protein